MATLYSSKLKSGTWDHLYQGRWYSDVGSWKSSQDPNVKGFWKYNYDNTATIALDENKNGIYDSGDSIIGTAYVAGNNSSKSGGTWDRFSGMTVGGFTGSSWGLFQIESPITFDTTEQADVITGSKLSDYINGKGGNDQIAAGEGNDIITGGLGADVMYGGSGNDKFMYTSRQDSGTSSTTCDTIKDFQLGSDKIDLSAINSGNLHFIGSTAFTGASGDIRFSSGVLSIDFNGDKKSDLDIALTGVSNFNKTGLIV